MPQIKNFLNGAKNNKRQSVIQEIQHKTAVELSLQSPYKKLKKKEVRETNTIFKRSLSKNSSDSVILI